MKVLSKISVFYLKYGLLLFLAGLIGLIFTDKNIKDSVEVVDTIYDYSQELENDSYSYADLIMFEPAMKYTTQYSKGFETTEGYYYYGISLNSQIVYFYCDVSDDIHGTDPLNDVQQTVTSDNPYRITGVIETHPELSTIPGTISTEDLINNMLENGGKFDYKKNSDSAKTVASDFAENKILVMKNLSTDSDGVIDDQAHTLTRNLVKPIAKNPIHLVFTYLAFLGLALWLIDFIIITTSANSLIKRSLQ